MRKTRYLHYLVIVACCFWTGLSTSPATAETVRIAHCFGGCPTGTPEQNSLIARAIYTLSFNPTTRIADWVAYVVTPGSIGVATNLSRDSRPDPYIDDTLQPGEVGSAESELELYYFAPLVSFAGTPYWSDVNFLTNRVPRNSELNRGSWYGLEWAVRNLANRSEAVYVLTGPVYGDLQESGEDAEDGYELRNYSDLSGVKVPGGFFKVVIDETGRMAAFVFPQDLPFHVHHCDQLIPVTEVESLTGLDLFPELALSPAEDLSELLGCFR